MTDPHTEPCAKCRGKGVRFYSRGTPPVACNYCKGVGQRQFKESAERRAVVRGKAKERKGRKLEASIKEFQATYPAIWTWMETADDKFAASLREGVTKYGSLTDAQMVWALRLSGRDYQKKFLI